MDERTKVLLVNAITYIQDLTRYTYESIAKELLGVTEKEWKELKDEFDGE